MSCNTNTCATSCASCTCCHVQNVTIDKQLCVGDETILRTCTSDGGALLVQNGCCTQTSGNLAHVCGEPEQIALRVENGRVQLDPNEALSSSTSVGVSVSNSTIQTDGELVNITGTPDQTALSVQKGETHLVSESAIGNALYVGNTIEQTNDELVLVDGTLGGQSGGSLVQINGMTNQDAFVVNGGKTTLDPNSVSGGALEISNSSTQSSGVLVDISGSSAEIALQVSEGQTLLDANASSADTLVVQNSDTQDSNSKLVHVIGQSSKMALQVDVGDVQLDNVNSGNAVLTGGSINNMSVGASTASTGSFLNVVIDPNNAVGGGLTVTNTATQSSDELVIITGDTNQVALKVAEGDTELAGATTVGAFTATNGIDNTVIGANTPQTGTFTSISIDPDQTNGGAVAISNTSQQTSDNLVTIDGHTNGQTNGILVKIDGTASQDALYMTNGIVTIEAEDDVSNSNDVRATSSGTFSTANAHIKFRGGVAIDGTDYSTNNNDHASLSSSGQIDAGLIVNGGAAVGGTLWQTSSKATDDGTGNATGGLLVGGGAIIDKNIIMVNATAPNSNEPGSYGELRIVGDTMYLYTGSEWRKSVFSLY